MAASIMARSASTPATFVRTVWSSSWARGMTMLVLTRSSFESLSGAPDQARPHPRSGRISGHGPNGLFDAGGHEVVLHGEDGGSGPAAPAGLVVDAGEVVLHRA